MAKRLRDDGRDFIWNMIGEGKQRDEAMAWTHKNELDSIVRSLVINIFPTHSLSKRMSLYGFLIMRGAKHNL